MKAKNIGIIGRKLGMTRLYGEDGVASAVTVIDFSEMTVVGYRTLEKDGYSAIILGYDTRTIKRKKSTFTKPKYIREFRTDNTSVYEDETKISDALGLLSKVDVTATMKGRGFAGVMKRWNFHGGPASHGSKTHRRPGSLGQCTFPAKVFKGKKMPGHYGNKKITTLSQKVVRVDKEKKLIFINGSVPGPTNGYVLVRDAIKEHKG